MKSFKEALNILIDISGHQIKMLIIIITLEWPWLRLKDSVIENEKKLNGWSHLVVTSLLHLCILQNVLNGSKAQIMNLHNFKKAHLLIIKGKEEVKWHKCTIIFTVWYLAVPGAASQLQRWMQSSNSSQYMETTFLNRSYAVEDNSEFKDNCVRSWRRYQKNKSIWPFQELHHTGGSNQKTLVLC